MCKTKHILILDTEKYLYEMLAFSLKFTASLNIHFLPENCKVHAEDDEDRAQACPIWRDVSWPLFSKIP